MSGRVEERRERKQWTLYNASGHHVVELRVLTRSSTRMEVPAVVLCRCCS
jgi:hypothetical protein